MREEREWGRRRERRESERERECVRKRGHVKEKRIHEVQKMKAVFGYANKISYTVVTISYNRENSVP